MASHVTNAMGLFTDMLNWQSRIQILSRILFKLNGYFLGQGSGILTTPIHACLRTRKRVSKEEHFILSVQLIHVSLSPRPLRETPGPMIHHKSQTELQES